MRVTVVAGCLIVILALLLLFRSELGLVPAPVEGDREAPQPTEVSPIAPRTEPGGSDPPRLQSQGEAPKTARWTIEVLASGVDALQECMLTLQIGDGKDTGAVNYATIGPSAGRTDVRLPWPSVEGVARQTGRSVRVELTGMPYGQYVVVGRLNPVPGRPYLGLPESVAVIEPIVHTRLDLRAPKPYGALIVQVVRGDEPVTRGAVSVFLHGEPVSQFPLETQTSEGTQVPAEEDLVVALVDYPGSRELKERPEQRVRLAPGEVRTIKFTLREGVKTVIEPVTQAGEPVESGISLWRRRGGDLEHSNCLSAFQTTQADRFVGHLRHGSYLLYVSPSEVLASAWVEFDVDAEQAPVVVRVPLEAPEGHGRLSVRYLGPDGEPLAGRHLLVMRTVSTLRELDFAHVRTDSRGLATARPLPPGDYRLMDWKSLRFWEVRLGASGSHIDIADKPEPATPYSLGGELRATQGMTPGVFVIFIQRKGETEGRFVRPDPQGVISMQNLEEGAYQYEMPPPWSFYPQVQAQRGTFVVYDRAPQAVLSLQIR